MLAAGVLPFAARLALPPLAMMLARNNAEAAEVICKGSSAALCPLVTLNLAGGASLPSNYIVHDRGLQPLPTYSKLGLGTQAALQIEREFGNQAPFSANSGILAGIRGNTTVGTRAKTTFVGVCLRSQDDSAGNKLDISGIVNASGYQGKILPNLGRRQSDTGTQNGFAYVRPNPPLAISRFEDLVGALSVSGSLGRLSGPQKIHLFDSIHKLSQQQARKIASMTGGSLMGALVQCAGLDNNKIINGGSALDLNPMANTDFATLWGLNANISQSSQTFVFASMIYNALNGNAGTINLEMGGYDYHDNTRGTGDGRDQDAGMVIGQILQSFSLFNTKGFVIVTTDGSTTSDISDAGGSPWKSDGGNNSAAYLFGFDPIGAHPMVSHQIGAYSNQAVDDKVTLGGATELSAAAMYANYMAFNKMSGQVETVLPRVLSAVDLKKILMFT